MRLILNFECIVLIYGINVVISVNCKLWKKSFNSKSVVAGPQNASVGSEYSLEYKKTKLEESYNPVLQNFTSLFKYLNTARRESTSQKAKRSRKKRQSHERNCAGLCEDSLCSWHEEYDEESTRIPRFIKYAVCDSPTCNFGFAGLNAHMTYFLQVRTQCDLVKTDILVTNTFDGQQRWLTNWPIACVCAQKYIVPSTTTFRHEGRLSENVESSLTAENAENYDVDVDITQTDPVEPVPRQQIILSDVRRRPLTHAQRRRLRHQYRHMQNTETWEHMMLRKYNRV